MTEYGLDLNLFLDELLAEMGMEDQTELRKLMEAELADVFVRTISMNADVLLMDYIDNNYPDLTDPQLLYAKMIEHSPKIQMAILQALEDFRTEMLDSMHPSHSGIQGVAAEG